MIRAWRLVKKKYRAEAFSGTHTSQNPGRWNGYGIHMVYACSTPSLAILEVRVHTGPEGEKLEYVLFSGDIPNALVLAFDEKNLPADWKDYPHPLSTQKIGTDWARSGKSAVLKVPSALAPEEFSLLLNPLHPDFKKIRIGSPRTIRLDSRLWTMKKTRST